MTKRTVCVLLAFGVPGLMILVYTNQLLQFHDVSMARQLVPPQIFHYGVLMSTSPAPALVVKADLSVKYKSQLNNDTLAKITSARKLGQVHGMTQNRIYEDYRFCLKEVPFHGPFQFIKKSKSPCFTSNGKFQCLPYFYLAGFSKSGTSDAYRKIVSHPQITSSKKETHWLDYLRYFEDRDAIDNYTSIFRKASMAIQRDIDENESSDIIFGDGTPCYIWYSLYWRCYEGNAGLSQPKYTNADVIHRMNPGSKIIVLMRDPVTRLYSRYLTWLNRVKEPEYTEPSPEKFHQVCNKAVELYTSCFKEWSPRHCAYNGTLFALVKLRLQEGMYSIFLKDWLAVFPRKQLLVLKFENYVKDIPGNLKKIYEFLEIDPLDNKTLVRIASSKIINVGKNYVIGPLLNKTRLLLQSFYKPFNKNLQDLLKDPSWSWGYE